MQTTIEAVYDQGVLRPLEPLNLKDQEKVRITVTVPDKPQMPADLAWYMTQEEYEAALQDDISLDEVRRALSTIPGSLSDTIRELRDEQF
ncbi:MAG: antitoxin family protein [Acidobacteria bacterium]|nr:antitoxin family protein [Acidobacteriota bacterium]